MDKNNIEPGKHYAIREHPNDDLQHVKIVESVRSRKWRAEWIDPNPGLIDYVASRHIIVPWGQRQALLSDERNAGTMALAVQRSGFPGDHHPIAFAVDTILDATSEHSISVNHGVLSYEADALERVAARAGIGPPDHPVSYRDRHGRHHLPWDCALALAEAFARNEPLQRRGWRERRENSLGSWLPATWTDCRGRFGIPFSFPRAGSDADAVISVVRARRSGSCRAAAAV